MSLLQKAVTEIRDLQQEEIDVVGGAWSQETSHNLTMSNYQYCGPGACHVVTAPDDSTSDVSTD
jgi:hypothetical protein